MSYYVLEHEYVGPNQHSLPADYSNIVDGHYFVVQSAPGRKNMSREPSTEGWLGTTADWAEYAHGVFPSLDEAENWIKERISETTDVGFRRIAPSNGDGLVGMGSDKPVIEYVRYYVGDEKWANLMDAADWLAGVSNDELGITASTTDESLEQIAEQLNEEFELNVQGRLYGLEAELERRRDRAASKDGGGGGVNNSSLR